MLHIPGKPIDHGFQGNYLATVPREHLVVLAMHIPLAAPAGFQVPPVGFEVPQRRELFEILSGHPHSLSLSSHMHVQYHQFFGAEEGYDAPTPHHHLVQATASAAGGWGLPTSSGFHTRRCAAARPTATRS